MLCCLLAALLAGNVVLAWRLVRSAVGRRPTARRVALAGAVILVPLAAVAALAGHAGHEAGGTLPGDLAAGAAPPLCSGVRPQLAQTLK